MKLIDVTSQWFLAIAQKLTQAINSYFSMSYYTVVLRRWESIAGNLVLTTEFKMQIGHHKE